MKRFALLFIAVLATLMPTISFSQELWQDDGLIWIDLRLIDMDARSGPASLQDPFSEPCNANSPAELNAWMPYGFRHDDTPRTLSDGLCERIIALRLRGQIDWMPANMTLPWQPGRDASRSIGIPREGAGRLTISFPEVFLVGAQAYQLPEPVVISVGESELRTAVTVPLRRLARAIINDSVDQVALDRQTLTYNAHTHFLLPGERMISTDKQHRLYVVAIDQRGQQHPLTDLRDPQRTVSLSANYGWTFVVEVVPRARTHRDWVSALRTAGR